MEPSGTNQAAMLHTEDKAGASAADDVSTLRLWERHGSVLECSSIPIISFVLGRLRALSRVHQLQRKYKEATFPLLLSFFFNTLLKSLNLFKKGG